MPESYAPARVVRCLVGTNCGGYADANLVRPWVEKSFNAGAGTGNCIENIVWKTPTTQYFWMVWIPDGTRYLFGTDALSTKRYTLKRTDQNSGILRYNEGIYGAWILKRIYSPVRDGAANPLSSVEFNFVEESAGQNGQWPGMPIYRGRARSGMPTRA